MSQVKPLGGAKRREQALATRRRVVDSAYQLFCKYGYSPTTVEMIARAAGVALQTVHYVFRTKGALLQEVVEVAAAGTHDPAPVMQRSWIRVGVGARSLRGMERQLARRRSGAPRNRPLGVSGTIHGLDRACRPVPRQLAAT